MAEGMIVNRHVCVVNLGLYQTGTTRFATAAELLGLAVDRAFPELNKNSLAEMLKSLEAAVRKWFHTEGGGDELLEKSRKNVLIKDGWIALLAFLSPSILLDLQDRTREVGVDIQFVVLVRMNTKAIVISELHHWVHHNLECKTGLSDEECAKLEALLHKQATIHREKLALMDKT
jgi:hypothetical protein